MLTSDTVMTYFDNNKQTEVITDASLSAIFAQHVHQTIERVAYIIVSRQTTLFANRTIEKLS